MSLEKYLAIAGLALSIFFVAEVITVFNFMSIPSDEAMFAFEAAPKLFQFISLSIAPAMIVIGVSFVLSKRYGSKLNGLLIISSGVVVFLGMIFAYTMIENIQEKLKGQYMLCKKCQGDGYFVKSPKPAQLSSFSV